jgi:hypothetical protein
MVDIIIQDLQGQIRIEPLEDATWQRDAVHSLV